MSRRKILILLLLAAFLLSGSWSLATCPSADLTDDCFVDFEDFAVIGTNWLDGYDWNDVSALANQWLTTDPCIPDDMRYIPGGQFWMGSFFNDCYWNWPPDMPYEPPELPPHLVYIDPFLIGTCEVTNGQYCDFLNSAAVKVVGDVVYAASDVTNSYPYCCTHSHYPQSQIDYSGGIFDVRTKGGRDMSNDPMVCVSWYGAAAYCNWRSQQEGKQQCYNILTWQCDFSKKGYRLPTEAEWEYAARGGQHSPYYRFPWGDTISHSQANYQSSSLFSYDISPTRGSHPDWNDGIKPYTSPVGTFSPNGYGLYDMIGNAWEWCNDWYDGGYYNWCHTICGEPCPNPTGPASGTRRVFRGGSWDYDTFGCRITYRGNTYPDIYCSDYGFRVALGLN